MIKKYHTSLLLTAITHFGCMHSQKLGMTEESLSQEPTRTIGAVEHIDALTASPIADSTKMLDCAESLTQRALACSGLTPITAQDLPQRALAFAKLMRKFGQGIAFGNTDIDLMTQHVIEIFPELLITSPVASLPEPANETAVAIAMYQYMIELLHSPVFLELRCALLCHPRYWPMPAIEKDIKDRKKLCDKFECIDFRPKAIDVYPHPIKDTFICTNPSTIEITRDLIDKFLLKFPDLLIAPDDHIDISLSDAILQGQTEAASRLLKLLEKAGMAKKMFKHQNKDKHTPLIFMPFSNCGINVLEKMLQLGAAETVWMQDTFKRTAIHYSVLKHQLEQLTVILEYVLNKFEEDGKQTVRTLLEHKDYEQNTPIVLAAQKDDRHKCLKALCDYWFAVNQDTPLPVDVIITAIEKGATKNSEYLGDNLDKIDTSGDNLTKIYNACLANNQSELGEKISQLIQANSSAAI